MDNIYKEWGFDEKKSHVNLSNEDLIKKTVERKEGVLGKNGALVVNTGKYTGRAAKDKYVVKTPENTDLFWWENSLNPMKPSDFKNLQKEILNHLTGSNEIFITERSVGADEKYNVGVRLITSCPSHALFSNYLFREKIRDLTNNDFTIFHAPYLKIDPSKFNTKSATVITTCFDSNTTIILGTYYAGEIKKSMFSVMNFLLPEQGILPMHSGVNQGEKGETSIFFGLSGTGKTTLSTDEGKKLIGDDEHGLSDKGIFNFEGGCYAKTYKLSKDAEPDIYRASTKHGSLLENVTVKPDGELDFDDSTITENGRSSYPLSFIPNIIPNSKGGLPANIFFLTADAFGVLPPMAKLNKKQAMFYFVLGYTAKVAGTEMGIKEPQATFSPCFGAPFMLRHPRIYANLLGQYIDKYNIPVWLINTGWGGGPYGVGERYSIQFTREIIRTIQSGKVSDDGMKPEPFFGLHVPEELTNLPSNKLNAKQVWKNQNEYEKNARSLAKSFHQQMEKFEEFYQKNKEGGPPL